MDAKKAAAEIGSHIMLSILKRIPTKGDRRFYK